MRYPFRRVWPVFAAFCWMAVARGDEEAPFAATIRNWIAHNGPVGVAVVLRQDGKTTFYQFGESNRELHAPVTPDTIFLLASITKCFTTTALQLAIDRHEMTLDDPAANYIPALKDGADITKVTFRELATHSSSLPRTPQPTSWHPGADYGNRDDVMHFLHDWTATRPIGSKWEYSNIGMGVIGYALEARAQQRLQTIFQHEILEPLGMTETNILLSPQQREHLVQCYGPKGAPIPRGVISPWPGGGALCSSARDMARFLEANLGEGAAPAALKLAMHETQQGIYAASPAMKQGLAWQNTYTPAGLLLIDKNGGTPGTSTFIGMIPKRHLGLIILTNRGNQPATQVGRRILFSLASSASQPSPSAVNSASETRGRL